MKGGLPSPRFGDGPERLLTCGGGFWLAFGVSFGPPCVVLCASSSESLTFRMRSAMHPAD